MRILFLLTESPCPPDNGTRIVSHNILKLMSNAGHSCAIVIIGDSAHEDKQALYEFCSQNQIELLNELPVPSQNKALVAFNSIISSTPYFVTKFTHEHLEASLNSIIATWHPDSIHYDSICLTRLCQDLPCQPKKIASINDCYTLTLANEIRNSNLTFLRRLYKQYQYFIVKNFERHTYNLFDAVHVVAQLDAEALTALGVTKPISVIPNGVSPDIRPKNLDKNPPHLIFVAKLAGENLSALTQFILLAWPIIKAQNPQVRLKIVGRTTLESKGLEQKLQDQQIEFLGFIKNLDDIYKLGKIAVVPINKNCGIVNKVIEAMAAGLAVVGFHSSFSALSRARRGEHYLSGESFNDLARSINDLLRFPDEANRIGRNAQEFAEQYYSWQSRSRAFTSLYEQHTPSAALT